MEFDDEEKKTPFRFLAARLQGSHLFKLSNFFEICGNLSKLSICKKANCVEKTFFPQSCPNLTIFFQKVVQICFRSSKNWTILSKFERHKIFGTPASILQSFLSESDRIDVKLGLPVNLSAYRCEKCGIGEKLEV